MPDIGLVPLTRYRSDAMSSLEGRDGSGVGAPFQSSTRR